MATSILSEFVRTPTYNTLVSAVQVYLNRYDEDTVNAIPFFINSAEKVILRQMRMPATEKIVEFKLEDIGYPGYILLPNDYIEMKFVWSGDSTLQRITFDQLMRGPVHWTNTQKVPANPDTQETYASSCGNEGDIMGLQFNAGYWAINADRMYIKGIPLDQTINLTYFYDLPELSEDTQVNPLLELLPDALLYLAVAEGWRFLMEPDKAMQWEQSAVAKLSAIQDQVDVAEYAGSPLTISNY